MLAAAAFAMAPAFGEDPWADGVVQYSPGAEALYKEPGKALGTPLGAGPALPVNTGIVSLGGPGGSLTLRFDTPVTDDPGNPLGLDCIVYSNAFWNAANPQVRFQEPALIEISDDVNGNGIADDPWYLIPGSRAFGYVPFPAVVEPAGNGNSAAEPYVLAGNIRNPNVLDEEPGNDDVEYTWGYAELNPTLAPYLDNYVRPDDPVAVGMTERAGGGDGFDIAWAVDSAGLPAGLTQFVFIRLRSFVSRTYGALGIASPEIDAVADVASAADGDGDGILDEYESRVAGTDPARPESTVLALETPSIEGGSPSGSLLGTATRAAGGRIRLFAGAARVSEGRAYSALVDIVAATDPGWPLAQAGLVRSGAVVEFRSSVGDFVGAGIQAAEFTMGYSGAAIAGLDEASLQPFRCASGACTQDGISDVEVNAPANTVTFRSRYAGLLVLASTAGSGDTGSTAGPQGAIGLSAEPAGEVVADAATVVAIASGLIQDIGGEPVADGTLITVRATAGTLAATDMDGALAGVQVGTSGGRIGFGLRAPSQSGTAVVTASSVIGTGSGELVIPFVPGPPAGTVSWTVGKPEGPGPVVMPLTSTRVRDQFGNTVRDGVALTITLADGVLVSGDVESDMAGLQVHVSGGRAYATVETASPEARFTLRVYADAAMTQLLGAGTFAAADYVAMPLCWGCVAAGLLAAGAWSVRRRR